MSSIDLGKATVVRHTDSFRDLRKNPAFSINDDTDIHISFFKRKDNYFGVRTGNKADFQSCEQFLVYSFLVEAIKTRVKTAGALDKLAAVSCSTDDLRQLYSKANRDTQQLPSLDDVVLSYKIVNRSDLIWNFLEEKNKYHSVFWCYSESSLFGRCA